MARALHIPGPEDLPRGHAMTPMEVYKLESAKCLSDDPLCEKVKHCMDQAALASLSASVSAKGSALGAAPKTRLGKMKASMESLLGVRWHSAGEDRRRGPSVGRSFL
mmetsp:Transcript_41840/g.90691  ORF Transcript_41840/g.90691 Transcript_41840/m.90691 type:complete len:107 (+) Transcript_41840:50-370(+)